MLAGVVLPDLGQDMPEQSLDVLPARDQLTVEEAVSAQEVLLTRQQPWHADRFGPDEPCRSLSMHAGSLSTRPPHLAQPRAKE